MKSRTYKVGKKLFRYDYDRAVIEFLYKADAEMKKDNEEWQAKYGRDLWEIGPDGYMVTSTVGLSRESWKDPESRREYLEMWAAELDEEAACLAADFLRFG